LARRPCAQAAKRGPLRTTIEKATEKKDNSGRGLIGGQAAVARTKNNGREEGKQKEEGATLKAPV